MAEWHITPDYIVNNWTDELFDLMIEKLVERKEREKQPPPPKSTGVVSNNEFFSRARNLIKVVKK